MCHKLHLSLKYTCSVTEMLLCSNVDVEIFFGKRSVRMQMRTGTTSISFFIVCNFIHVFALKKVEVRAAFVSVSLNMQRKPGILNSYRDHFRNYIKLYHVFLFSFDLFIQIKSSLLILTPGIFNIISESSATVKTNKLKQNIEKNNFTLQRILPYQIHLYLQIFLMYYWQCHINLAVVSKSIISFILGCVIEMSLGSQFFFFFFLHTHYANLFL